MDSSIFGDGEVGNYYEVAVSNVIDNSFDFAIYGTNMGTGAQDVVYGTHTATFVGDGSEAVCNGSKLNLTFSFRTIIQHIQWQPIWRYRAYRKYQVFHL